MATKIIVIEQIYNDIRNKILKNEYAPGTKLSENSLATGYDCSRTPVREAIKRLEQDGFVTVLPHSGSYVKEMTIREYQYLAEMRSYLESLAFRLNCEKGTSIEPFADILDKMDACDIVNDVLEFSNLHFQFHLSMVEASGNETLYTTFRRLNLNANSLLFYQQLTEKGKQSTQDEHRKILAFLANKDIVKGERFMFAHLWRKRNKFKKHRA